MQLKYVGPKPIISHHGISFDNNKEDKYTYLPIVVHLLKALSHDYLEDKTYHYDADISHTNNISLLHDLLQFCPEVEKLVDKESHSVEDEIQENIKRAHDSQALSQEEIEVLTKNITLMHEYLLQRSVNKAVYYAAITALAKLVEKDHIDHIITPMFQPFVHVLHSLQGILAKEKAPVDTKLDIYKQRDELLVKLQVITI